MQNSGKLLVKVIEKFTEKFKKSQLANYYTMLTMKYCIKLLDSRICKILLIKKSLAIRTGKFFFIHSTELNTK